MSSKENPVLQSVKLSELPVPSLETLLKDVKALLPAIRGRAEQSERDRSIPMESAREFLDIGLARVLLPRRYGGMELGLQAWVDICVEIGRADAAHAWCASLMMHHPHYLAQFPDAAQSDVWEKGPDVSIALTFTPTSKVEIVEGGYRLSCSIPYLSGINHSSRVVIGGMVPTSRGAPDWTLFLVPGHQFTIKDTWQTAGMRGTGSNTVLVEDVFVPVEHTLRVTDMRESTTPGAKLNPAPMFRAPWIYYAGLTFVAPMLGAARGALEDYRAWTSERISLFGSQVAQYTSIQVHLARAAANLDAADLLMRRCVQDAEGPDAVRLDLRARAYRDQSRASELIVDAIDMIMKISGAGGFASSSNIQRAWRDVHFAASHVGLNPEVSFAAWGREQFGLERDPKQNMF
jgi:3-hydroxy-9,10-secoandrosta-1,3,5(10)-triene-9,17-dione monooxygenase